eukprot:3418962-Rhodomonas_salina.1
MRGRRQTAHSVAGQRALGVCACSVRVGHVGQAGREHTLRRSCPDSRKRGGRHCPGFARRCFC